MRSWAGGAAMLVCGWAAGALPEPACASDGALPPPGVIGSMRRLTRLQESIAQGNDGALSAQATVVGEIARQVAAAPGTAWSDVTARLSLVRYVLSGGDPRRLGELISQGVFAGSEATLARGTLSYAKGDRAGADGHLASVDLAALPAGLGAHVALIRSVLVSARDPTLAFALCGEARLRSPGTLVEEAALRVTIELAARVGDRARFEHAALAYARRFSRSVYRRAIEPHIAAFAAANDYAADPRTARWLDRLVAHLEAADRPRFLTLVAEHSLRGGKLATAHYAGEALARSAGADDALRARALAFQGAAGVLGKDGARAAALLDGALAGPLPKELADLVGAARALARDIAAPAVPNAGTLSRDDRQQRISSDGMVQARKRVTEADRLLEGQDR